MWSLDTEIESARRHSRMYFLGWNFLFEFHRSLFWRIILTINNGTNDVSLHQPASMVHVPVCSPMEIGPPGGSSRPTAMMTSSNFPRYWHFVRGIHRSRVNSPHKGQWRGALVFSLICAWTNGWANNRDAGDLRRHHAHYDVTVMACNVLVWPCCKGRDCLFCCCCWYDHCTANFCYSTIHVYNKNIFHIAQQIWG